MQKGKGISTLAGVIIIIVAIIILFGGVFVYQYFLLKIQPVAQTQQNKQQQTANQQINNIQPVDQTAGWKTYTNTQYGFEVKYPPFFKIEESQPAGILTINFLNPDANNKTVFSVSKFPNVGLLNDSYGSDWKYQNYTTINGISAKELSRVNFGYTETSYIIADKSISINFGDTNYHKISSADLDKIFFTFKFAK